MSDRLLKVAKYIESGKPKQQDVVKMLGRVFDVPKQPRQASHSKNGPSVPTKLSVDVSIDDKFNSVMDSLSKFQNYENKSLVLSTVIDIKNVISKIAEEIEEIGLWELDEGERTIAKWDYARRENSDAEALESSLKSVKREIDTFIDAIKGGKSENSPF